MTNICMRLICVFVFCVAFAQLTAAQLKPDKYQAGFQAFLAKVDAAQVELQNGKAEAFKSVWSQADDVTLSGGFGGTVEKGWTAVAKRLDWVGKNFSKGKNTIERLVANNNETLGYVIQLEHIRFTVPGNEKETTPRLSCDDDLPPRKRRLTNSSSSG